MPLMTDFDNKVGAMVQLEFHPGGEEPPKFQFPPICTSDNKQQHWVEKAAAGTEDVAVRLGERARALSLEATWVIDGGLWTGGFIFTQLRAIKSHFYLSTQKEVRYVRVNFYEISTAGGTYRMNQTTVKHEGPYIRDGGSVYPMISVLTMELLFYSKQMVDGKAKLPSLAGLVPTPVGTAGWY